MTDQERTNELLEKILQAQHGSSWGGFGSTPHKPAKQVGQTGQSLLGLADGIKFLSGSFKEMGKSVQIAVRGMGSFGVAVSLAIDALNKGVELGAMFGKMTDIGQTFGGSMFKMMTATGRAGLSFEEFHGLLARNTVLTSMMNDSVEVSARVNEQYAAAAGGATVAQNTTADSANAAAQSLQGVRQHAANLGGSMSDLADRHDAAGPPSQSGTPQATSALARLAGSAQQVAGAQQIVASSAQAASDRINAASTGQANAVTRDGLVMDRHRGSIEESLQGNTAFNTAIDQHAEQVKRDTAANAKNAGMQTTLAKSQRQSLGDFQAALRDELKGVGFYGMALGELTNATVDYLGTLQQAGLMNKLTIEQQHKAVASMLGNVAELAVVWGKSRADILKATNDAMQQADFSSILSQGGAGMAEAGQKWVSMFAAIPGKVGAELASTFATQAAEGGFINTDMGMGFIQTGIPQINEILGRGITKFRNGLEPDLNDQAETMRDLYNALSENETRLRENLSKDPATKAAALKELAMLASLRGKFTDGEKKWNDAKFRAAAKQAETDKKINDQLTKSMLVFTSSFQKITGGFIEGFYEALGGLLGAIGDTELESVMTKLKTTFKMFGWSFGIVTGILIDTVRGLGWAISLVINTFDSVVKKIMGWFGWKEKKTEAGEPKDEFSPVLALVGVVGGAVIGFLALIKALKIVAGVLGFFGKFLTGGFIKGGLRGAAHGMPHTTTGTPAKQGILKRAMGVGAGALGAIGGDCCEQLLAAIGNLTGQVGFHGERAHEHATKGAKPHPTVTAGETKKLGIFRRMLGKISGLGTFMMTALRNVGPLLGKIVGFGGVALGAVLGGLNAFTGRAGATAGEAAAEGAAHAGAQGVAAMEQTLAKNAKPAVAPTAHTAEQGAATGAEHAVAKEAAALPKPVKAAAPVVENAEKGARATEAATAKATSVVAPKVEEAATAKAASVVAPKVTEKGAALAGEAASAALIKPAAPAAAVMANAEKGAHTVAEAGTKLEGAAPKAIEKATTVVVEKTAPKVVETGAAAVAAEAAKGASTAISATEAVAEKGMAKVASKVAGRAVSAMIPGVGLAMGGLFAYQRAQEGDFMGASLEVLGGLAGLVPVVGGFADAAVQGVLLTRDLVGQDAFDQKIGLQKKEAEEAKPGEPTSPPETTTPVGLDLRELQQTLAIAQTQRTKDMEARADFPVLFQDQQRVTDLLAQIAALTMKGNKLQADANTLDQANIMLQSLN